MFGKAITTGVALGLFRKLNKKRDQAKTQTQPKKKKKKVMQTSGAMQMKRGGKGRRSLIVT